MIVVDASTVVQALAVDGEGGEPARRAVEAGAPLHGPWALDLEVVSGIRGLHLGGKLDARRSQQARTDLVDLRITRHPHLPHIDRIWELRDNLSAYDAAYVALAEALGCGLFTSDAALGTAPGVRCEVHVV